MMRKVLAVIFVLVFAGGALCAEPDPDLAKEVEIGRKAMARIEEEWPITANRVVTSCKLPLASPISTD